MRAKISRRKFLAVMTLTGSSAFLQACRAASLGTEEPHPTSTPIPQPTSAKTNQTPANVEVAIVGAGIAGLTAAYALKNKNIRVLEANTRTGGRTVSGKRGSFNYAKGTEYLGPLEGVLQKMTKELGLQVVEIPEPMDAFFRKGHMYVGSAEITHATVAEVGLANYNAFVQSMLDTATGYEDLPSYTAANPLAKMDLQTAKAWFDQIGAGDIFVERYNVSSRGLFGASLSEISALCAVPEFAYDYEEQDLLKNLDDIDPNPGETLHSGSYSFMGGITDLTNALAAALGDKLELNAAATRIARDGDGYLIEYANGKVLRAERVILAVPAPQALRVASDGLSARQRELMAQVEFAPYITCSLFSNTPIFNKSFDLALPDGRFLTDLYDSTWVQRHLTPNLQSEETYVASAYIAGKTYRDENLLKLTDEQIFESLVADLSDVVPDLRAKVTGYDVQRFPYAYPVLTPGAYARMLELHKENSQNNAILLAGDYMIYPTFEAAAESGLLAAEHIV